MVLELELAGEQAGDVVSYLLHKRPGRLQTFPLTSGRALFVYASLAPECVKAAMIVEVDPVGLVRRAGESWVTQFVNDRPYVASSLFSVAIAEVLGSALNGRCAEHPHAVDRRWCARVSLTPIAGQSVVRRLFEPLGYEVATRDITLDSNLFGDEPSGLAGLTLSHPSVRLQDLLAHLYVLTPVLDDDKHYYIGRDEVEKLLKRGEGWLAGHPEQSMIVSRYLKHQKSLTYAAIDRLKDKGEHHDAMADEEASREEEEMEEHLSLHRLRLGAVLAVLKSEGARRVLDLGCGEGKLLRLLLDDSAFEEIVGVDVDFRLLEVAMERLKLERVPAAQSRRLRLLHGSLAYRDGRLAGFDAAAVVEVIEHLDPLRLPTFERVLFEFARPRLVVLTTPNIEYNSKWPALPSGRLRHRDHRFEWCRAEFEGWAKSVAERFAYKVRFLPVGPVDPVTGPPTQMAVFSLVKP
jgi:3' terminal RNA ribose 2'-O-methyltransferase Hen1